MAANALPLVAVLLFLVYASLASAATHTVGGVHSWMASITLTGPAARRSPSETNYGKPSHAVFSYVRTDHTVTKVSKSEYDACSGAGTGTGTGSDAMGEDNTSGLTTVTPATPGMHYFICIVPNHCASGMKLAVNVSATPSGTTALAVTGTNAGGGLLAPLMAAPVIVAATATGVLIELGLL